LAVVLSSVAAVPEILDPQAMAGALVIVRVPEFAEVVVLVAELEIVVRLAEKLVVKLGC
jgi:hypothetical protein